MTEFNSVEEVLNFAIDREQEAFERYRELAEAAGNGQTRDILNGFAAEEAAHRRKLEAVKAGTDSLTAKKRIRDLKISDYLPKENPHSGMSFKETLTYAMQWENAAAILYNDLAKCTPYEPLSTLFQALAMEEKEHKARFEGVYLELFPEEKNKNPF